MNSKTKIGIFSMLLFGVMMLLIPATSIVHAEDYDSYYEQDQYYDGIYRDDKYNYEEYYYPPKDKKMKEPPMLLVKKDVLYCDVLANGTDDGCDIMEGSNLVGFQGQDSGRYVQNCTVDNEVCLINESIFDILVTDNIEFPGSEEGKKLNFNGERYTVTEDINAGVITQDEDSLCQESGFDSGFVFDFELDRFSLGGVFICTIFEDCSGIVEDGELKECIIKNYLVFVD